MAELADIRSGVRAQFNGRSWHDSKLREFCVYYAADRSEYEIRLRLEILTGFDTSRDTYRVAELRFSGARIVRANIDLLGLSYCGGDISAAECYEESPFLGKTDTRLTQEFMLPQESSQLKRLLHFQIALINPAGKIDIVATDFHLIWTENT
jgi:hypothetical protein